ncbi:hypothetical protein [Arthrobacter bambusae]|uniref:hypothetical protein n=1 Tax=Arthrobacter bambusae TaxID=1338426 RepID=UPI0027899295|nr:hypothetical protein [Arthrobacter bambusae]MDQ0029978.1 hypothetical protein [Arthrobacter bambusae]MDQ0097504.1 hypothetical protein [Arthrobacter bambusae]
MSPTTPPAAIRVPPKAIKIPATETVGASAWSSWAGVSEPTLVAAAAEARFCIEGLGLETAGGGTAATVVAGGATWVGAGSPITSGEGIEAGTEGTATPGFGWGCGCTGGLAVADGVGFPAGRGDGELPGEHMPTTPRRP